jgi:hypothetical protein
MNCNASESEKYEAQEGKKPKKKGRNFRLADCQMQKKRREERRK